MVLIATFVEQGRFLDRSNPPMSFPFPSPARNDGNQVVLLVHGSLRVPRLLPRMGKPVLISATIEAV
jgi:hypothetical protein